MKTCLRPYKPSDLSFIFDSWLNSWRVSRWAGTIPNHLYYDTQRACIEGLIHRGAQIVVLGVDTDPNFIIGWMCFELKDDVPVVHYIYIKDPYREFAFERQLLSHLPPKPGFVTHRLPYKEFSQWKHAPEIARRKSL